MRIAHAARIGRITPRARLERFLGRWWRKQTPARQDRFATLGPLVSVLLFLTPIIYPVTIVPERWRGLLLLNPMAGVVDAFRATALAGRPFGWTALGAALGLGLVVLGIGLAYFTKAEREFADVI